MVVDDAPEILLALEDALDRLTAMDARKGRALELIYYGGLTWAEAAHALSISEATLDRDLRMARAWIHKEMEEALR
jgi:DNA-directed RNA polymerase specialized sigma24 family protein